MLLRRTSLSSSLRSSMAVFLPLLTLAVAPASRAHATDQLVPGGSTFTCRGSEGRISSKTMAIGDPVLCTLNPVEFYGRSVLPYGSYIEGRFVDYKDPGHFVGKGWMELDFDRMVVQPDTIVPINARVIQAANYKVDDLGRIDGKGHAVKDVVTWLIPVLWPIDLINLPRRGPRPTLKPETQLTLELMNDLGIPDQEPAYPRQQQSALIERVPQQQAAPQQVIYQTFQSAPQPAPRQQVVYQPYYPPPVIVRPRVIYAPPPPPGYGYPAAYGYPYGYVPAY